VLITVNLATVGHQAVVCSRVVPSNGAMPAAVVAGAAAAPDDPGMAARVPGVYYRCIVKGKAVVERWTGKRWRCEHGGRRERCKECGGSAMCEHGRRRERCKECRGSTICEHGRRRSRCKERGCGAEEGEQTEEEEEEEQREEQEEQEAQSVEEASPKKKRPSAALLPGRVGATPPPHGVSMCSMQRHVRRVLRLI
jgi:hypothetical protein